MTAARSRAVPALKRYPGNCSAAEMSPVLAQCAPLFLRYRVPCLSGRTLCMGG
jgi:hypothetical protein